MRHVLAAVLLLVPAVAGCLDGSPLNDIRNDLEAEDEYEERELLAERVDFSPTGIPDSADSIADPSDVSDRWNGTVTVPPDTRSMTVRFAINFTSVDEPDGSPVDPPDGEVRVFVDAPSDDADRSLNRTESAQAGFDFTSPEAGEWTVGLEARGEGTVTFNVDAIVPIQSSGS
jgi:hypothetical protein